MTALAIAFRQVVASMRLLWLIYGITLVLGLLASLPFYSTLIREDQNSLAFLSLLNGFDYTAYADFMHRSSRTLTPLISVGRWLGLIYLVLNLYLAGGILLRFAQPNGRFNIGTFWQSCQHYVGRFLRLFGVIFLFLVVGAGLWLTIGSLIGVALSDNLTERGQFWIGLIFFVLFALTATLILCIGDYAKVVLFREDERGSFRAFGQAGRFVIRNPARTYGLYCLLILVGTGLFSLYFLIDAAVLMHDWLTIAFVFIVQQTLIFVRVGLKVWSLGTAYVIYGTFHKPLPLNPIVTQS